MEEAGSVADDIIATPAFSVELELNENNHVHEIRPQAAHNPRQVAQDVIGLAGMSKDASAVGAIAQEGKEEEK